MIKIDKPNRRFLITTSRNSYAMQANPDGFLTHLHWGGRISRMDDLPAPEVLQTYRHCQHRRAMVSRQEYPAWGGEFYGEPALKADFPDGARTCILHYDDYSIKRDNAYEELEIILHDKEFPLKVHLFYRVYHDMDIIERWSEIANNGDGDVTLRSVLSASFNLPRIATDYRLTHLSGRWGKESTIERQAVNQSRITIESKTGLSGPFAVPFFALDEGGATEHGGRVFWGTLLYSGNWKIAVERDAYEQVSASGGIHDFDFSWPLRAGERFTTPKFCAGISNKGFGGASRMLHRYQRYHLAPSKLSAKPMPMLFNSWGSMETDVSEEKIMAVARKAAEIGAELFVIDDGWQESLGDWTPDLKKFPRGLKPIIEQVKALGMDFGLWVEIESFEIASRLYHEHPEWALTFPQREAYCNYRADIARTSLMLNFAIDDVSEYMYKALKHLIETTGISYLKLDMNCFVTSPGWDSAPRDEQQTVWIKYARNLQNVFIRLQQDFPELLMENCAAGAGRADLSMDRCFGRMNRSDNQDTLDILRLHEGFTWLHPSRMAGGACHISDSIYGINMRRVPMKFQAYAGMMGSLAVGKNLLACTADELAEIRSYADLYKRLRHIPQLGELYRLISHFDFPYAAFEFVAMDKTEALLFVFSHSIQFGYKIPAIRCHGLQPEAIYTVTSVGGEAYATMSGLGLEEIGLSVELLGDYDAKIIHLRQVTE